MRKRAFETLLRQLEDLTVRQRGLVCVQLGRLISGEHAAILAASPIPTTF